MKTKNETKCCEGTGEMPRCYTVTVHLTDGNPAEVRYCDAYTPGGAVAQVMSEASRKEWPFSTIEVRE